jgi:hypothetical protein
MGFVYPQNREIRIIGPIKVARMSAERVGFEICPMNNVPAARVEWVQSDNFIGLQQLRGLDGAPSHVKRVGKNRYGYEPGVYGEFETIEETELTKRAGSVTTDVPIDVSDLVLEGQKQLIIRELDRQESIIWTLLSTGTFSITSPNGQVVFTDTFAVQTYAAGVAWATLATAAPFVDFRAAALLSRGKGVRFDATATAYMNQTTANNMLNNTNANDIGGKREAAGANFLSLSDLNKWLLANDLPQIKVYDEGYYDDTNTFQLFIPNAKVVVVGKRTDGETVGEYQLTRNANNPGYAPGSYEHVEDRTGNAPDGQKQVPANIKIHRGHNGGPVLFFPSAIVVMSV